MVSLLPPKAVDAQTMRAIDLEAQEKYGIPEILLMESAGREIAQLVLGDVKDQKGKIAFFCGKGNNGGDGFVAARYLFLENIPIALFFVGTKEGLKGSARIHFEILERLGCPMDEVSGKGDFQKILDEGGTFSLGVDALLGIGLKGDVKEPYRSAIGVVNQLSCPILAVDIPSGLCATTGKILGCCVQAERTLTFGLPKKGFYLEDGPSVTGDILVKNIGYPKDLLS